MTVSHLLAFVPLTFEEWLWYLGLLTAGGITYFLGNLFLGAQRSGGKRLIVFLFGVVLILFSLLLLWNLFESDHPREISKIIPAGIFGILFGAGGLYAIICSFFSSPRTIDGVFAALIRGI